MRSALAGLAGVAAAVIVVAVSEPGRRAAAPRVPDGYLVYRAPRFTLFAPSPESLRDGAAELSHAAAFEHYFGTAPPPIDVVLTPPPGAGPAPDVRADVRAMARPGVRLLPFMTNGQLAAMLRARVVPAAGATSTRARGGGSPPRVITLEEKTLAHEACHTFVAGYADVLGRRRWSLARFWPGRRAAHKSGHYGHPALPDWFNEMAATLCEEPATRARRRAAVGDPRSQRIALRTLLRMEHPIGEAQLAQLVAESGGLPGRRDAPSVHVLTGPRVRAVLAATNAVPFYAESMLLGEFIYARGGAGALRRTTEELVAGHDMDATLREVATTAPGVPSSVAALEAQWPAWLSTAAAHP